MAHGITGSTPACRIDGCERPARGRGWCEAHYRRWKRTGSAGDELVYERVRDSVSAMTISDEPWRDLAACRGRTGLFFATDEAEVARARAICADCPVLADCRAWVTANPQRHGVFAGMTAPERDRLRRGQRRHSTTLALR